MYKKKKKKKTRNKLEKTMKKKIKLNNFSEQQNAVVLELKVDRSKF